MAVWMLEAYDTDGRNARCREYTTSRTKAEAWARIPRIDFTDSGHGIVFNVWAHQGRRKPTINAGQYADRLREAMSAECKP